MSAGLKGKLTVTIHKARDLKDVQTFGKQDPYCVIQLGTETFKTRVHNNGGKDPSWEQAYLFNLSGVEDAIHIKINDSEALLDRPIGRVDIALVELINSTKNGPAWFLVHDVNNFSINAGNLSISTSFDGTGLVTSSSSPQPQQIQQQPQQQQQQPHIQHQPSGNLYPAQQYQQQQQQQQQHAAYSPQPIYQQQPQQQYQPQQYQQVQYSPQQYQSPPPQYQQQPMYQQQPVYQQQPSYSPQPMAYQQPQVQGYTPVQPPSTVVYASPPPVVDQVYVPPVVFQPGHPQYGHHHPHHHHHPSR